MAKSRRDYESELRDEIALKVLIARVTRDGFDHSKQHVSALAANAYAFADAMMARRKEPPYV